MNLSDVKLTLFFTGGYGIKTWFEIGNYDREIAVYRRLADRLNAVNFIAYGGQEDKKYAADLYDNNIGLCPTPWHGRTQLNIMNVIVRHWRVLRESHVLKTNQIQGSEIPVWIKKRFGKKLIVRCGWLWSLNFEKQTDDEKAIEKVRMIEKNAFDNADIGIVTTEKNRQHIINRYGISDEKIRVIPNYVETDRFYPVFPNERNKKEWSICHVGRHSPEKNLASLFYAVNSCRKKLDKDIRLDLFGSGPQSDVLKKLAEELHLNVRFHGNIPNSQLASAVAKADLFVFPSLYENHPKALLEAMSCGLPCIGSDVEGVKELIVHGETGYLCDVEYQSIASAIEILISNDALRLRIGKNARSYIVENFSLEKVFKMELGVLQEVVSF